MTDDAPSELPEEEPPSETFLLQAKIIDLKRLGFTFEAIGKKLGFSKQYMHTLYWKAMHEVRAHAVHAHRAAMLDELMEVVRVAQKVMHTDHFAHSNGRIVEIDGQPIIDDGLKLDAGRTIVAAQARLSKLVGADEPTKADISGGVELNYTIRGVDTDKL